MIIGCPVIFYDSCWLFSHFVYAQLMLNVKNLCSFYFETTLVSWCIFVCRKSNRFSKMFSAMKTDFRSLIELLKGFRTIRRDWKNKTPLQRWLYLRSFGDIGFGLTGIPLYRNDRTLHLYSYFAYSYMGLYTTLVIYTACFYIARGEFGKFLPSTCLLVGPLLAVSFKIFSNNN